MLNTEGHWLRMSRRAIPGFGRRRGDRARRAGTLGAALLSALAVLLLTLGATASAMTRRSAVAPSTAAPSTAAPPPRTATSPIATIAPPRITVPPAATGVVTVGSAVRGRPMPEGFVGLSIEYRALLTYLGSNPSAINPVFVNLLRGLAPDQDPVLRIGGDSTDWTWWPVPKVRQPPGVTYDITPSWVAVARALAQETQARYILGINLEANSRAIEMAESGALLSGIGRQHIAALELGNEPELYSKLGWYRSGSGVYVPGRSPSFDFTGFTNEFSEFRKAISPVPTAGPSTGSYWWMTHLPQFLAAEPSLGVVTVHSYWLDKCLTSPSLPGYPTVANLLNPHPPSRLAGSLPEYAALAHARGIPIRIDEMNAVTCGGEHGVSDVFASALWALNALFEAMSDGVDGVNIHTFPGTANQLFGFSSTGGQWAATVRPEYYGLLMFAQAAPPGAKLLKIAQAHTAQTRVWATKARDGITRVVLINDSLTEPSSVLVRAPSPTATAQLEQLLAPSVSATSGITLGGQSFGASTTTGTLAGSAAAITLAPSSYIGTAPAYAVTLPAASAAMLTIAQPSHAPAPR
jgi:hypothetical protein